MGCLISSQDNLLNHATVYERYLEQQFNLPKYNGDPLYENTHGYPLPKCWPEILSKLAASQLINKPIRREYKLPRNCDVMDLKSIEVLSNSASLSNIYRIGILYNEKVLWAAEFKKVFTDFPPYVLTGEICHLQEAKLVIEGGGWGEEMFMLKYKTHLLSNSEIQEIQSNTCGFWWGIYQGWIIDPKYRRI